MTQTPVTGVPYWTSSYAAAPWGPISDTTRKQWDETQAQRIDNQVQALTDMFRGAYNPRHYGAVLDGVTDDTAAMQACLADITYSGSDPKGAVVILPFGTALVNDKLVIPKKTRMFGVNRVASRILAGASFPAHTPLVVLGDQLGTGNTVQGCRVENLQIDCNNIAAVGLNSTQIQEMSGGVNVGVVNYGRYGVWLGAYFDISGTETVGPSGGCQNFAFHGLVINNGAPGAVDGVRLEKVGSRYLFDDLTIAENSKQKATSGQTTPGSGSYTLLTQTSPVGVFASSGTIFCAGQTITYTGLAAGGFTGCTGGYGITLATGEIIGQASTQGLHMTTSAGGVCVLGGCHVEGYESGVYAEAGVVDVHGISGHAVLRYLMRNGSANASAWSIGGIYPNSNSGGTNSFPVIFQDDHSAISYTNYKMVPRVLNAPGVFPSGLTGFAKSSASPISDSDFAAAPLDGTMGVWHDTGSGNDYLMARSGGVWKRSAALT